MKSPFYYENLTTHQERTNFHLYVAEQLRQKSFASIEREILQAISQLPNPEAKAAVKALAHSTELLGHENLLEIIIRASSTDCPVTAVGIDLYGNDCGEGELSLEISVYDNSSFPFQSSSLVEIQAAAKNSVPWQGGFIECDYGLGISHLDELRDIWVSVRQHAASDPEKSALSCLLEAALYTRVHTCLHQKLPSLGLPKAMPVIISENDWGHAPTTIFHVEKILNPAEVRSIRAQTLKDRKLTWSQQVVLERNEGIRSAYETISQLPPNFLQSKIQKRGTKLMTDMTKSQLAIANVDMPKNLFRMPRKDFEQFMSLLERLYEAKA